MPKIRSSDPRKFVASSPCIIWAGKFEGQNNRPVYEEIINGHKLRKYAYRIEWERKFKPLTKHEHLILRCGEIRCVNTDHYRIGNKQYLCYVSECDGTVNNLVNNLCAKHSSRWYRHNDVEHLDRATSTPGMSMDYKKKWVDAYKLEHGCTDCGYRGHTAALDFDHLPGSVKVRDIKSGKSFGWVALQEEIAKCEVVCANCHRIRTYERLKGGGSVCFASGISLSNGSGQ